MVYANDVAWFCADGEKVDALIVMPHTVWITTNRRHVMWPYTPEQWGGGYIWYIQHALVPEFGNNYWGYAITATDRSEEWTYPNIGYGNDADVSKVFHNLTYTASYVSFRLNTTDPRYSLPRNVGPFCNVFLLSAWASGRDPWWSLSAS